MNCLRLKMLMCTGLKLSYPNANKKKRVYEGVDFVSFMLVLGMADCQSVKSSHMFFVLHLENLNSKTNYY